MFALTGGTAAHHHHRHAPRATADGPLQHHVATYYSVPPCDKLGTRTASGQRVRFGIIASDEYPLGTRLRLTRPLHGRTDFQVEDTGAPFDVWLPCGDWTRGWNNPTLYFHLLR